MIRLSQVAPAVKQKKPFIHLAINAGRIEEWCAENNTSMLDASRKLYSKIFRLLEFQVKREILILTINLKLASDEERVEFINFLRNTETKGFLVKNSIRVYVLGKWYALEQELVDAIKDTITSTAENSKFFFNICVNYNGQEEILDAFKNIGRKLLVDKVELDELNSADIKENVYSSNFPPPQVIIETENKYSGLLLWDSKGSYIYFARKHFLDLKRSDVEAGMECGE
ncbi:MAG: undecaprenyl diphosphate synthase family protein [Candidatus Woesearchaeota archaeon]